MELARTPNTLQAIYSHLNKACQTLFNWSLGRWPRIQSNLVAYANGYSPKKSKIFTKDQLGDWLNNVDVKQRLALQHAFLGTVAYCGGLRMTEAHSLLRKNVELVTIKSEVYYQFDYLPAKQRKNVRRAK